eukprot:3147544-Amphidinium_carterae.2
MKQIVGLLLQGTQEAPLSVSRNNGRIRYFLRVVLALSQFLSYTMNSEIEWGRAVSRALWGGS